MTPVLTHSNCLALCNNNKQCNGIIFRKGRKMCRLISNFRQKTCSNPVSNFWIYSQRCTDVICPSTITRTTTTNLKDSSDSTNNTQKILTGRVSKLSDDSPSLMVTSLQSLQIRGMASRHCLLCIYKS
mgnify:CR=1 FL=1